MPCKDCDVLQQKLATAETLLRDAHAFLRSSLRHCDDREHTPWFDGLKHMVLVLDAALAKDAAPAATTKEDRWDKCVDCEHYRGEHSAKGECMCLIINMSGESICGCRAFAAAPPSPAAPREEQEGIAVIGITYYCPTCQRELLANDITTMKAIGRRWNHDLDCAGVPVVGGVNSSSQSATFDECANCDHWRGGHQPSGCRYETETARGLLTCNCNGFVDAARSKETK